MSDQIPFSQFELDERILNAIDELGFQYATPIQAQAIPALVSGKDVIGRARTGSGKTAAFGLPLLQRVRDREKGTRAIVLCPTRELALQVSEAIRTYARKLPGVRIATIYGGSPYPPQIKALRSGSAIVVGTPGRVIDHMDRGTLKLDQIEAVVLDEADEMLRMGFIEDVRKVLDAVPTPRQVMLFSATMPPVIRRVANEHLHEPINVQVEREALSVDHIEQFGIIVPQHRKLEALRRVLLGTVTGPTLVFARTRLGCAETADTLAREGLAVDALHGNLTQSAREHVLGRFRARGLDIVIATDVAARGLDVDHISHVINLDLPHDVETYVHRIGRTGRAGRKGAAISFLTPRERRQFRFFENKLHVEIHPMTVPSDATIARHKQTMLIDELREVLSGDLQEAQGWVQQAAKESGLQVEEIAAAAMALLAKSRGATLELIKEEAPAERPTHDKDSEHSRTKKHPAARPRRAKQGHTGASPGTKRPGKGPKKRPGKGPKKRTNKGAAKGAADKTAAPKRAKRKKRSPKKP
ncbi:MAG: DEAD/DEAH box helicase [Polyangiaceae bacterium]